MNKYLIHIVFLLLSVFAYSQSTDEQLANHYFNEGDCEKAIPYFEKVYREKPNDFIYNRYLSCLKETNNDKEVISLINKQIKTFPNDFKYKVALGNEFDSQGDSKRAEKTFQNLIDDLRANPSDIINLQKAFFDVGKHEWALKTLKKGDDLMKGNYQFHLQYADVYGALNEPDKMIASYLDLLDSNPNMISSVKILIPRAIDFEEEDNERFTMFQNELIMRTQANPRQTIYSELLIWALVQKRNFAAALVQAKALDKRTTNDGREVYNLGNQALKNNDFTSARNAFKYIVDLGDKKPYYFSAEQLLLTTRFMEITSLRNYTEEQIEETLEEYQTVIDRMPKNGKVVPIMREMAYIQAYFGNRQKEALKTLDEALSLPRYNDLEDAKTRMLKADIYVLLDEVWEASLLYMQIEKKFKFEQIGEEAKFKNARIFYYDGDFKFAQSQLDILKEATTRLIANDAMNLSILITDNLGMDSNYVAMRKFAKADLLLEQHRYDEAFKLFDEINKAYPTHNLTDDILMRRAKAAQNRGKWEEAIGYLQEIVDHYGSGVLADDALFQIAQIYENHLFDRKKAAEYYFQIMKDYPGSLFVTEARKAYREIN